MEAPRKEISWEPVLQASPRPLLFLGTAVPAPRHPTRPSDEGTGVSSSSSQLHSACHLPQGHAGTPVGRQRDVTELAVTQRIDLLRWGAGLPGLSPIGGVAMDSIALSPDHGISDFIFQVSERSSVRTTFHCFLPHGTL